MNLNKNRCQTFPAHHVLLDRPCYIAGSSAGSSAWASHRMVLMAAPTWVLQLHQTICLEKHKGIRTRTAPKSFSKLPVRQLSRCQTHRRSSYLHFAQILLHQPPPALCAAQWRTRPGITWLGGRRDPFSGLHLQASDYSDSNLSKCIHTQLNVEPDFHRFGYWHCGHIFLILYQTPEESGTVFREGQQPPNRAQLLKAVKPLRDQQYIDRLKLLIGDPDGPL